jgi:hypothetical protein
MAWRSRMPHNAMRGDRGPVLRPAGDAVILGPAAAAGDVPTCGRSSRGVPPAGLWWRGLIDPPAACPDDAPGFQNAPWRDAWRRAGLPVIDQPRGAGEPAAWSPLTKTRTCLSFADQAPDRWAIIPPTTPKTTPGTTPESNRIEMK